MKILLINSDLAKNRGDRAIAEGIIELLRSDHPEAEIVGLSERAERDRGWFGIDFFSSDVHSLNPIDWIKLARIAKSSDVVYWGGGELLKDYTNKFALWYWCLKILWVSLFNKNVYGAFQGIGPTKAASSKKLIAFVVRRTRRFAVRDHESFEKLLAWGVPKNKVLSSVDPAVLTIPEPLTVEEQDELAKVGCTTDVLEDFIAIAPRDWFHYQKSGFIPHRYKKRFVQTKPNPDNQKYRQRLVDCVETALDHAQFVVLMPMHLSEDVDLCRSLVAGVNRSFAGRVLIMDEDVLSPLVIRKVLAAAKLMIGFRLHSNIIATSGSTPSINYYYVDKGRVYFDQIEQSDHAFAIEDVLDDQFVSKLDAELDYLVRHSETVADELDLKIGALRQRIRHTYAEMHERH